MGKRTGNAIDRRSFVKLLPAMGAAGLALPHAALSEPLATQAKDQPEDGSVTLETLQSAEALIGISFTQAEAKMALQGVNTNLKTYQSLRKIDVPLDTEPAFTFHPGLPGRTYPVGHGKATFAPTAANKPASTDELAFLSATELGALIHTRQVSPVELTKLYIERLKKYSPKLECLITVTEELAMEQARQAELDVKRGRARGPLHGVPWGAKDLLATKGIPTTWGAEPYRNQVIDCDATVVERLRKAGAILVAKLSMGALAQGGLWFGGDTKNPWKITESSSGSAAGPASATSAGLVGFSIGTETLGSIVSPSSTCGVTGLRPTYGRVSRYGAMALSWTMDKIGPICRTAEDCAAAFAAIFGPDGHDSTVADVQFNWPYNKPLGAMRIGYVESEFGQGSDEQQKVHKSALDALRSAGAKLTPVELPKFQAFDLFMVLEAEAAAAFDDLTRSRGIDQLKGQKPGDWPNSFRTSRFIPAVEFIRGQRARRLLMQQMDDVMAKLDVLVTPAPRSQSLIITNFTGHPTVCAPCGFVDGRPQAIMFTSNLYDEAAALKAAIAYQKSTDWHKMHPKLDWA